MARVSHRWSIVAWALTTIAGLSSRVDAQAVRTETVLPRTTDAAIDNWLGAHAAAILPGGASRGQLFVYLHGQGGTGTGAMELLKTSAEQGFHVAGITYPNDWSPFNVCGGDPACPENLRREIIDGVDRTPLIAVNRTNSMENRLVKLLAYLDAIHPGEGWGQFADAGGAIRWETIVVWGHSMGGGNAGVIAKYHPIARLCLSANAADGGPGSPAAWWSPPFATPGASTFGFCHTLDSLTTRVAFWNALGLAPFGPLTDVAASAAPFGMTHELSTSVPPAVSGQYHNSVVSDAVTPRNADHVPVYKPVWKYMMTGGESTPQCPCPADFNGSGGTPDASDVDSFFQAWLAGNPVSDADCSGGAPDTSDIDTFFAAWLAGGC